MKDEKQIMLITGASGRIGRLCVRRFSRDYKVIGFARHEFSEEDMQFIPMDVGSAESVSNALKRVRNELGGQIASVIHLAAHYSFSEQKTELYDAITVQGTRRLLEGLHKYFDKVDQILFSSTLLVHAPCQIGEKIDEDYPLDPKWDYPKSKVKTEKLISEMQGDIPAVIMRIAGCYDNLCHSIPLAHNIQRIYEHELQAHFFPGDSQHGNPFLHLDDLLEAISLTINKKDYLPHNFTVIIGEDKTVSYRELQNLISEILDNKDFALFRIPKFLAKEGAWLERYLPFINDKFVQPWMIDMADDHYALDINRARNILCWEPVHFVKNSLPVMMELLKTDPIKWYNENRLKMSEEYKKFILSHAR